MHTKYQQKMHISLGAVNGKFFRSYSAMIDINKYIVEWPCIQLNQLPTLTKIEYFTNKKDNDGKYIWKPLI